MLLQHFNLGAQPFGVTPDPRFLFLSKTHREAFASLHYGMHFGRGFAALIAAPGMGKTTLLIHLLGLVKADAKTAFLFQTLCGPEEFLRSLLADLGIEDCGGDVTRMHAKLNSYLLKESKDGRQLIVVIDEAQNLDDRVLELVRMLSNFETPRKKLMQIVLCGQPQLAEKLASERLIQLRQRISIVARLTPFNADETREYIEHRLHVAGATSDKPLFSKQAYAMIAKQSGGIPRNINNLCFNAMSLACALKRPEVDASMVQETVDDMDLPTLVPSRNDAVQRRLWLPLFNKGAALLSSLALLVLIGIGLLAYLWPHASDPRLREHTQSLSQSPTNGDDPEPFPASKVSEREDHNPIPQPDFQPENTTQPLQSSVMRSPGQDSRHKAQANRNQPSTDSTLLGTGDSVEVGPLPIDLEWLQNTRIVDLSLDSQFRGKTHSTPEQKPIPFETAPQREKP
jgi:type II secretory pathway predicted ATPase ExeA